MSRRTVSLLVDTDIFIDYFNGMERMREALDAPDAKVYDSIVTKHELTILIFIDKIRSSGIAKGRCFDSSNRVVHQTSSLDEKSQALSFHLRDQTGRPCS